MEARIFPIFPQSTSLFAKVLILTFAITTVFFVLLSLAIYAVIEIDGEVGRIAAPVALGSSWAMMLFIFLSVFIWYYLSGRRPPFALIEQLKTDQARIIDLRTEPEYQPGKKIFAIKAFFFYGGAYFLKNGEKAHVFYTGMPRVVYIPMHSEHALLLGPQDPEGFLHALRESASS